MNEVPQVDGGIIINHLNDITNELRSFDDLNNDANAKKNLIDLKSYQGAMMLLINEMAQTNIHYTPYWMLQYFVPICQLLLILLSPFIFDIWPETDKLGADMRKVTAALSFSPSTLDNRLDLIGTIVIAILYVLIGLWFSIVPAVYLVIHRYPKGIFYVSVVLSQICVPFLLIPFATNIAFIFPELSQDPSGINIFLLIVFLIVFVLAVIGFLFLAQMQCFLIAPSPSPVASYRGIHPALTLSVATFYIILSKVAESFENWLIAVVMVIHILCNVYFIYDTFQFPFVMFGTHVLAASLYSATILSHILSIVSSFIDGIPLIIRIVLPYAVFILALIVYFFIFRAIRNKIYLILCYTAAQTDQDRREYYDSLNIKGVAQFDKMCRIGMSTMAPLILDWTFPIYSGEITGNINNIISAALFVTFFPCEQQAASYFIEQITKKPMSSFRDRFILYRIQNTYLKRYSSNSEESTAAYIEASKFSENTLMEIREFWMKIATHPENAQMSDLEHIGRNINLAKRKWASGLDQYPNDSRFPNGYSQFLLEAMVDPENGMFMKLKSSHLLKGFSADIDPIFRAFGIARPFIFKEKICDKHGNIKRNAFEITTGTTITISTTAMEKLEEDLDAGVIDKMIFEMYNWPNLRKSFKRATTHFKPRFHMVGLILTIIGIILYIVIVACLLALILPIFDNSLEYFNRIQLAIDLRNNIAIGKCALILQWAREIGILFTEDQFISLLTQEVINSEPSTLDTTALMRQVAEALDNIVTSYISFSASFNEFMATQENTTADVSVFVTPNVQRDVCTPDGYKNYTELVSLKNALSIVLNSYYNFAYSSNINFNTHAQSMSFCMTDLLFRSITSSIDIGIDTTRDSLLETLRQNDKNLTIYAIVFIILSSVVFYIIYHSTIIIYYIDAKKIFECLLSLDPSAAKQGSDLVLNSSEHNDEYDVIQSTESMSSNDIIMIILDIILCILMAVFVIVLFVTTINTNKSTIDFVDWSISGSKRLSVAYEALSQLSEAILLRENPPHFTTISESLEAGKQYLTTIQDLESQFYSGSSGIKGRFEDIDFLHSSDQCQAPSPILTQHDYYQCQGIDQLIPTFVIYGTSINEDYLLNSTDFIDLFHLTSSELASRLTRSQELVTEHTNSAIDTQIGINIAMIILFLISMIGLIFTVNKNASRLKTIIKVSLILFRRIPPPAIANCKTLTEILVGPRKDRSNEKESAHQVIFDSLPTAVLAVARDETIEAMNEKAKKLFGFLAGQIVGQHLECLIHKVDENSLNPTEEVNEEYSGSIRLYSYISNATQSASPIIVYCHCSDDSMIRCEANLYTVTDFNGNISNFVLFLQETKDILAMEAKLKEAKEEVTKLMNQLIPSDVQGFIRGDRKDFSFLSKTVTVVAIQVYGFFDAIKKYGYKEYLPKMNKLLQHLEAGCIQFPPMMRQRQFTDTFIALGGLFNVTDDSKLHAQAAIQYAQQMIEDIVDENQPFFNDFRIQVGIATGGPLICGLVGEDIKEFDAAGPLIDDAIILAENSAPSRILVGNETKELLPENEFEVGSIIEDRIQSFWVPSFVDIKVQMPVAQSGSFMTHLKSTNSIKQVPESKLNAASILAQGPIAEDDIGGDDQEAKDQDNNKSDEPKADTNESKSSRDTPKVQQSHSVKSSKEIPQVQQSNSVKSVPGKK